MTIPEKIWNNPQLDTLDKLILGTIINGGERKMPGEIAQELGASKKHISQRLNQLCKDGFLTIEKTVGEIRMEVRHVL